MLKFLKAIIRRRKRKKNKVEIIYEDDLIIELNRETGSLVIKANRDLTQDEIIDIMRRIL